MLFSSRFSVLVVCDALSKQVGGVSGTITQAREG